jgi:SAM-dependent methyltransferase
MGTTWYRGREYPYSECSACATLYCDPMPDPDTVAGMYGQAYGAAFAHADVETGNPRDPDRVVDWLERAEKGTFLDFGCGDGELLAAVSGIGWRALGVELDEEVADRVGRARGLAIHSDPSRLPDGAADVVHLGDVIEHLTEMDRQLAGVLRLVRPGGMLIAQGPLEANDCLFTWTLRCAHGLRPARRVEMPPYHVVLATAGGQRTLFRRFGLAELEFRVSEVAWPAPERAELQLLGRPRELALFCLRRASQALSRVRPAAWGNRYFYVGRREN